MSSVCKFCSRKFNTHQGLSSHYKCHKNLPVMDWVEKGPRTSKIKTAHFKAQLQLSDDDEDNEKALSPEPLRAIKWVSPNNYVELSWLTRDPDAQHGSVRPPGPSVPLPDPDPDSDRVGNDGPLLDLNLPPPSTDD